MADRCHRAVRRAEAALAEAAGAAAAAGEGAALKAPERIERRAAVAAGAVAAVAAAEHKAGCAAIDSRDAVAGSCSPAESDADDAERAVRVVAVDGWSQAPASERQSSSARTPNRPEGMSVVDSSNRSESPSGAP